MVDFVTAPEGAGTVNLVPSHDFEHNEVELQREDIRLTRQGSG